MAAAAAFSRYRGHFRLPLVLALGAGVLLVLSLACPTIARDLRKAVASPARFLGAGFSVLLLSVVWIIVVLPVWLLNGLVRIDLLTAGSPRGTTWQIRRGVDHRARGFGSEPHRSGEIGQRGIRVLVVGVLVVVVGGVVIHHATTSAPPVLTAFGPRSTGPPTGPVHRDNWTTVGGVRVSRSTFPGEPWGAALLDYLDNAAVAQPDPRYGWRNADLRSRYVNVVDGTRVSLQPSAPVATVWMFGGSTTYGIGQRDEHTIASDLVREARRDGMAIEVVNFGVSAYVNWQETLLLGDLLDAGGRPDLAIFLDGANEIGVAWEREVYCLLDGTTPFTGTVSAAQRDELRAAARARGCEESHDPDRQASLAGTQYRIGVQRARRLANRYGVPIVHFWQPQLATMAASSPGLPTVLNNLHTNGQWLPQGARLVRRAAQYSGVDPVDLTSVFDHVSVPVFIDWAHTNEAGASIEAEAIFRHLRPRLTRAVHNRSARR